MSTTGRSRSGWRAARPSLALRRAGPLVLLAVALAGCGGGGASPAGADRLTIGAYSVVREALHDALLPAFAARWKEKTGRTVTFEEAYNGSGAQARAIKAGFEADVAILSLEEDMDLLVSAGLVKPSWKEGPRGGILTHSLVVIGYRPENPKGIRGWDDLAKPGVGVLYPDPKTSGGARWNVNALYGYALLRSREARGGKADPAEVRGFLAAVQGNVVNMDASGRQSVANFERGTGDAIVTYENELLLRKKQGREVPYVIPPATLLIEGPAALVDASVDKHKNRQVARAFLDFLESPAGQAILAEYGFRPVDPGASDRAGRPLPAKLFTMKDLGGWGAVKKDVYGPDGVWSGLFSDRSGGK